MILIELMVAFVLVVVITIFICELVGEPYVESSLIGIIILIIATQKLETLRLVDTSPIISLTISAFMISVIGIFLSTAIHKITH